MTIRTSTGSPLVCVSAALFLGIFVASGAANAAGPFRPFQFGSWSGGAWTNDQTGAFSHCAASVPYASGITMFASINRFFGWSLGFGDPRWVLTPKTQIPIELHFDGGPAFNVYGTVLQPTLVEVPMSDNSKLINTFRSSMQMTARAQGQSFLFNLNGTYNIMVQLANCVRTALALENGQPGSANPQQPTTPLETPAVTQDVQLEAMQLATNFLLAARMSSARVLPRSEMPTQLSSFGAAWKATDAVGGVKIFLPRPGLTGLEIASDLIGADSQTCKGKFESARSSELVDSDVVFRASSLCVDSANERAAQYFIAPRSNGGFVAFLVLAITEAERQATEGTEKVDLFKKAALTAVTFKR